MSKILFWGIFAVVVYAVFSISGCNASLYADTGVSMYRDPFGMTTREMVRQDGETARTKLQTDAQMEESYNRRKSEESKAFYSFASNAVWAGSMPIALIIVGLFALLIVAINGAMRAVNAQIAGGAKMLPHYEDWKQ